jgi:hypothetical protein
MENRFFILEIKIIIRLSHKYPHIYIVQGQKVYSK